MAYEFKENIDNNTLDTFLEEFGHSTNPPGVTFIQSSNWAYFQENLGKESLKVGIYKDEKLIGAFVGIVNLAKRGKYLYIRNGPVLDWSNKELVNETINFLKSWAKKKQLWFIRISPLIKNSHADNLNSYRFPAFQMNDVDALDTWISDLSDKTEEELLASFDKKTRYSVNKTYKDGVTSTLSTNKKDLELFYPVYLDTVKRQQWVGYPLEYIQNEFEAFAKEGKATLILSRFEGKVIGGGVFVHYANQTYYHFGATLSEFAKLSPAYQVIWEAMKETKRRNIQYFNFWGIAPNSKPNHPWQGLTSFKKKFPGTEVNWNNAKDIPITKKYWLTHFYDRINKIRKGY